MEFLGQKFDTELLIGVCHDTLYKGGWYEAYKHALTPEKELEYLKQNMAASLKHYALTHQGTVVEMTEIERKLRDAFTAREFED